MWTEAQLLIQSSSAGARIATINKQALWRLPLGVETDNKYKNQAEYIVCALVR